MARKTIVIAIPTDFPPEGFVGTDLKPQGLGIDVASYIAARLGVTAELVPVTSANRSPYLQTKKADLVISTLCRNPEREKVIDFTVAYSPFYQAVFAAKSPSIKGPADLAGKSVGVTRGAIEDMALTKVAPASADVKRFEDNIGTVSAFVSGQVQMIATGASVAGNAAQPGAVCRIQVRPEGFAELHWRRQGRGQAAPEGQRDHPRRQGLGRSRQDGDEVARSVDWRFAAVSLIPG